MIRSFKMNKESKYYLFYRSIIESRVKNASGYYDGIVEHIKQIWEKIK